MTEMQQAPDEIRIRLDRVQRNAIIAGAIGLVLVIIGALVDLNHLFQSYLFAYLFWLGISTGCLMWLMIHGMTGGRWGDAIHSLLESSALLVVLMALLFIPLLFGLPRLYLWAQPDVVAHDALLQHKQPYLNVPFFIGRAALYFVIWAGTILLFMRWWQQIAQQPTAELGERIRRFSGFGLALYGLTVTFGAIDWVMSLEPHWYSTIFGVLVAAQQASTSLAFAIMVIAYLVQFPPYSEVVTEGHMNDLGNLLLTTVIFWTYIAFVQFFIIWSGNLPEDVVWYVKRLEGGWSWVGVALIVFHAAIPFALLLSTQVKRSARRLSRVALLILAADLLQLFWLVAPTFSASHFTIHWLDLVMPVFLGGVWIAVFIWMLRRQLDRRRVVIVQGTD